MWSARSAVGFALAAFIAAFALPANAATIAAMTGHSKQSDGGGQFYYMLGKGLEGNLQDVYVTINDNGQTGYITNVQLMECDTYDYQTPGSSCQSGTTNGTGNLWLAQATVGSTNYYTVPLTGTAKRTIHISFAVHSQPGCNPGVNCTGTTGPINLDPTKWYVLYFQASQNAQSPFGSARSVYAYGITNEVTDAYGYPILCGTVFGGWYTIVGNACGTGFGTPYYILADAPGTSSELTGWGFATPSSTSSGFDISGANEFCADQFPASDSFGIANGLCNAIGFLFIPSRDSVDQFFSTGALVQQKIPFSYVVQIKQTWDTASSTSQGFPAITVPWHVFGASTSLTLVSSASFYKWVDTGTWSIIRGFTTAGMWLGFMWFLWRRGRHFLKRL